MFKELAKRRYSVRKFKKEQIPEEELMKVLDEAMLAPTSQNDQPQRLMIIESEEAKKKLKKSMTQDYGADKYLVLAYDNQKTRKRSYQSIDGGTISATNFANYLMLSAADKGMGTIWIGAFNMEQFVEDFQINENLTVIGLIAIGYPAKDSRASKDHGIRKSPEEIITRY
ncbi:MAG: nitroreductase family protein [Tissierellia bacterium]|nr:nitroreductase family protein [Tissierellia bacterium]